jgi:hypothetical protein
MADITRLKKLNEVFCYDMNYSFVAIVYTEVSNADLELFSTEFLYSLAYPKLTFKDKAEQGFLGYSVKLKGDTMVELIIKLKAYYSASQLNLESVFNIQNECYVIQGIYIDELNKICIKLNVTD